jgi:exosortase
MGLAAATLLALWFVLCRQLSGEWSVNEQYSYGWFVPFFAAFLFWLRWHDRPRIGDQRSEVRDRNEASGAEVGLPSRSLGEGWRSAVKGRKGIAIAVGMVALLILFPVRLFEVANPDWRPLGWLHAFAVIAFTFVVIYHAGGWAWVKHFSFPILFFLVAVPWISPIEQPIVQGLMRTVAAMATEALSLCGIPAQLEGSLIRVSSGLVGVNEACSGVRSLQTSIMIGLLFGELKRLSAPRRLVLLAAAIAIALIANLFRAIFLVWIASTRELSAVERWHDLAGYAIVGVVFLGSLALTTLLAQQRSEVGGQRSEEPSSILHPPSSFSPSYFLLSLAWLIAVEAGVESWYRAHEKDLTVVSTWNVRAPEKAPGFREIKIDENVRQTLRFDEGREVVWKTVDASAPENSATNYLFFFRWHPGTSTILRARAHRPDVCLPNVGWRQLADHGVRSYRVTESLALRFRHFSFVRDAAGQRAAFAHAFFCMREDKVKPTPSSAVFDFSEKTPTDWSPLDRWRVMLEGLRNPGQQAMEFVLLSPGEIAPDQAEARFAKMVPELVEQK